MTVASAVGGALKGAVKVAGLMSGTSLDGVDAAVLEVEGDDPGQVRWRLVAFRSDVYPSELRERLARATEEGSARELALLHRELGRSFARSLRTLLDDAGIDPGELAVAGSHGQTFWHEPPGDGDGLAATLQLGCPATLAEEAGVPVVSDFRARDVAAGGHGAPLVPWSDWVFFRREGRSRALQNLGGMGNVTYLPADGATGDVVAFDTGPGVALIDGAAQRASGGADAWDVNGRRAHRGTVRTALLAHLLDHPFFRVPPPRSTGRETFGERLLDDLLTRVSPASDADWDDVLATLTEFTAVTVAEAYDRFLPAGGVEEVVLTGGGARNPALVEALGRALHPRAVRTGSDALGMDPDAREAAAFALLAWAHLRGIPANLPGATGASGRRVLGSFTPGPSPRPKSDPAPGPTPDPAPGAAPRPSPEASFDPLSARGTPR